MDDKKSENIDLCLVALDMLVHVLVCQGIAPCYVTLELIDILEISVTDWCDIVSSRDLSDLKTRSERSLISGVIHYYKISRNIWWYKVRWYSLMAYNFWLVVACHYIAPCYAI